MGGACNTNGRDENCTNDFSRKPEERRALGSPNANGKIILKWIGT
jgi:hypothetical protein